MKYLLAHDLGTSGNKVTLFTTGGELIDSKVYEYDTKWFNNGWAEQNAEIWYEAVCSTTKSILENVNSRDVVGVSFSGQMMGCLCIDSGGEVLHNPIIWADKRAIKEEAFIKSKISISEFYKITGHRPSASYTLAKLLWIKNNFPDIYNRTYKVLNAKDYILYRLTGSFVTDYSDASGTNLLDINTLQWSTRIADITDIDLNKMPELQKSTDVIGYVNSKVSSETSLFEGTPIICGGGDGVMSAVGAKSISDNDVFCTIGTSAWCASTSDSPLYDNEERTFNFVHAIPGKYVPCGTMEAAGASINWIKSQVLADSKNSFETLNSESSEIKPGSDGLYFLPYLLGERSPRWDSDAKGCFIGINMETSRGHMFRAVYEGIAMNLDIILKIIINNRNIKRLIVTGGGVRSPVLCRILADMFNIEILIPNYIKEATSIGAAVTAGVGIGIYESFDIIDDFIKIEQIIKPDKNNIELYKNKKAVFESLYQALKPVFKLSKGVNNET